MTLLIDALIQEGIDYFCIAPGARSASLALAVAKSNVTSYVHFDERGLGFHALGYGKGALKPACLIVTSGTATANLFPAVMEGYYSETPLLLLTADRPMELREMGSNQTVDQVKLFGSMVRFFADVTCWDSQLTLSYYRTLARRALHACRSGPVHLNCQFREYVSN